MLRLIRNNYPNPDAILVYNAWPSYAFPAWVGGQLWRVPVVLIVADLVGALSQQQPYRRVEGWLEKHILRHCSGLIALSNRVASEFGSSQPTLILEGGIDDAFVIPEPSTSPHRNTSSKSIMYAGTLSIYGGVPLLLKAFKLLKGRDYELWITGRGELVDEILAAAARDSRIKYFGFVERNVYVDLMGKATVLVNPRPSDLLSNRYNFPSKLLEYMASGRPVITTSTSGLIEEEYGDMVFVLREETPQALAKLIETVCNLGDEKLNAIGARARNYMLEHKTWGAQSRRVYEFLSSLQQLHSVKQRG